MKITLIIFLLFYSLSSFSQITFNDVLAFEKKSFKEIQSDLFQRFTVIRNEKKYTYVPIKKCNSTKFVADTCQWACESIEYGSEIYSKYPLERVVFNKSRSKNYEKREFLETSFGENYNSVTKSASTFIDLYMTNEWSNGNCENKLKAKKPYPIKIDIQFSNISDWNNFKKRVAENSIFSGATESIDDIPATFHYAIRRRELKNGSWQGVWISLYEGKSTYHVKIVYDTNVNPLY
jgi:hypothetical protein